MTQILSILASILTLSSGGVYIKQLIKGESIPNPATWLIWLVVTIINTATYFIVVKSSFWISLSSIALACGILIVFIIALVKGKFASLGKIEIISLLVAFIIGLIWKISNNAVLANTSLQVVFLISFYPTVHGLLNKNLKEKSFPWFLAATSYILQIIIVFLNSQSITLFALTFPIINLAGNGVIGLISYHQNNSRF